jgi:hypothetical protein
MKGQAMTAVAAILLGLGCTSAVHDAGSERSPSAVQVIRTEQIGSRAYDMLEVLEDSEMIAGASIPSIQARLTARLQKQAAMLGADAIIVTCSSAQQGVISCRGAALRWKNSN